MVEEREGGQEGHGREGQHQSDLFYVDDGMLAPPDQIWLQGELYTLARLLNQARLRTNTRKPVGMVCRPCQAEVTQSEAAYEQRTMG